MTNSYLGLLFGESVKMHNGFKNYVCSDAAVIVLNASSEVESKKLIAVALDKELCEHKVWDRLSLILL